MEITVVIPAYNAGRTIARALDSVAKQAFKPSEVIVINDGSIDETASIVEQHPVGDTLPLKLISTANSGVSSARNTGIRAAGTPYIALLDADDEIRPDHLEMVVSAHRVRPDAVVYWAGIERVFDNDSPVCLVESRTAPDFNAISLRHSCEALGEHHHLIGESVYTDLIRGNFICSAVFRKEIDGRLQLFNEALHYAEDRLFYLDLLSKGAAVYTPRQTMVIHRDGLNTSAITDQSKSLAINSKVLAALQHVKQLDAIRAKPDRLAIANQCIDSALTGRIYHASLMGLGPLVSACQLASATPEFKWSGRWGSVAKSLVRATLSSARGLGKNPSTSAG